MCISLIHLTNILVSTGAYAERFWGGFTKCSWGSGGRCEPPSGVRGGGPEDFEIDAFQRLRTPVFLSFLSQCCYTNIHAIFFIHSHPHHFQLNEVVPNHTLWYQKSQCQRIAQFWVLFFTFTMRLVGVLNFGNSSSLWSKAKRSCSQSYPHALSASPTVGRTACTCVLDSLYSPWDDALPHWCCPSLQQVDREICCINDIFTATRAERSKPVQNAALRASEIRILPHKLRKRRSLPFCTTSGVRPPSASVHVVARREWAKFLLVC